MSNYNIITINGRIARIRNRTVERQLNRSSYRRSNIDTCMNTLPSGKRISPVAKRRSKPSNHRINKKLAQGLLKLKGAHRCPRNKKLLSYAYRLILKVICIQDCIDRQVKFTGNRAQGIALYGRINKPVNRRNNQLLAYP